MNKNCVQIVIIALVLGVIPLLGMKKVKFQKISQNYFANNKNNFGNNKRFLSNKRSIAAERYYHDKFYMGNKLEELIKNELTLMKENNPNLTINDMFDKALNQAEIKLRTNVIPEESERLLKEYNDSIRKMDYDRALNEALTRTLDYRIKDEVKAGALQRKLSKELNMPFSPFNKEKTGYFDFFLKNKKSIAAKRCYHDKFYIGNKLEELIKNELTLMKENNPNLTINDMFDKALNQAEIKLRTNVIPEESERLLKEYNDSISKMDYDRALNEALTRTLDYRIKDEAKAGILQRKLSKELNIPLDQLKKESFSQESQANHSSNAQKLGFWQRMTQRVKSAFGYGK